MILLIDNYDSFSYNVFQLVGSVNPDIRVIRNDECSVDEIRAMNPSHIILSPGPGRPDKAGVCENVIRELGGRIPILGICLGHQAICEVAGATVTYASHLMHGKQSLATLDTDSVLFRGMKKVITVARYHSLVADPQTIPAELKVTAVTEDGEVMAVEQTEKQIYGVQFHPESVLTPDGRQIIVNFLQTRKGEGRNMIKEAVAKLVKNENIGYDMAKTVMDEIMSGEASDILKSAYLTALSQKGETIEEITGSAEEMRKFGRKLGADVEALEIVGTGGDGSNSFNISNHGIDGMKLRQLTTLGPVSIYKCTKTLCADCGKPIAPDSVDGICSVCRIKRRTKKRQEEAAARAKERAAEREAKRAAEEAAKTAAEESAKAAAQELAAENAAASAETAVPAAPAAAPEAAAPTASI